LVFYCRQYERLKSHRRYVPPPDGLTDMEYEKLIANRKVETRVYKENRGPRREATCLTPKRHTHPANTASRWQAYRPVGPASMESWRNHEPWWGELREFLPSAAEFVAENTVR
jgi:hypothetical protein